MPAASPAGSSAPDLSLIPSAAIDHVEVLLDGAAAQYGTDAVSGVVNIILKNKSSGGSLSATWATILTAATSAAARPMAASMTCPTIWACPCSTRASSTSPSTSSIESFTQYGGADERYVNNLNPPVPQSTVTGVGTNGVASLSSVGNPVPNTFLPTTTGYPRINSINGNPEYQLTMAEVNSEYDFSDNFSHLCLRHDRPQIRQIVRK